MRMTIVVVSSVTYPVHFSLFMLRIQKGKDFLRSYIYIRVSVMLQRNNNMSLHVNRSASYRSDPDPVSHGICAIINGNKIKITV